MFRTIAVLLLAMPLLADDAPFTIRGPLVVNTQWPECTTLAGWTRDVMRIAGVEQASETQQAKAFFQWLRLFSRMAVGGMIQAHEGDYGQEKYVTDSHKNLFVYGWGYCDTTSRIAEAAWSEYKQDRSAASRVCVMHDNGGYHTMYRLRLDGKWGAFDPRYGYYLLDRDKPDARILDWAEVGKDENIQANRAFRHRSSPFFEYPGLEWERALLLQPRFVASEKAWIADGKTPEIVFGDPQYQMGTAFHDMQFALPRGWTIERFWDNSARKVYQPANPVAQREERFRPSGRFYRVTETMFDGNWPKNDPNYALAKPYLETIPANEGYSPEMAGGRTIGQSWGRMQGPLSLPLDLHSPYILIDGELSGRLDSGSIEVRALKPKPHNAAQPDEWTEWIPVVRQPGSFKVQLDRSNGVYGVYRLQIRSTGKVTSGKLLLHFENGIMTLPRLFAGTNPMEFKLQDAGRLKGSLRVTYRYQAADGERTAQHVLRASDFVNHVARYTINAPGLTRCRSVAIHYEP